MWDTSETEAISPASGSVKSIETKFFVALFLVAALGGAIRKWFTDSSAVSNGILFLQMAIPFLLYYFRSAASISPFERFPILRLYFFYLVCEIFNPYHATVYHGILGIIIYGGLWLGFFFYLSNRKLFQVVPLMWLFIAIAALETILAFIQYQLPADHFLNRYADTKQAIAFVSTRVRITGTFSYLSGFNAYTLFYSFFVLALIRLKYNPWIISIATAFGLITSFMTGSRGGTLIYLLIIIPVFIKEFTIKELVSFFWKLIIPAAIGFTLVLLAKKISLGDQIYEAYDNFFGRVKVNRDNGEESSRLVWDLTYFFDGHVFKSFLFGVGTGSTYQGATALFGVSPAVQEFGYVEGEFIRIFLEGGLVLMAFKFIMAAMLVKRLCMNNIVKAVIFIIIVYGAPVVFNPHNATFLFLGVVLVDNIVWRQQIKQNEQRWRNREEEQQQLPAPASG